MLSKVNGEKPPIGVRLIGIIHISFGLLFIGFAAIAVSGCIIGILTLMGGLVADSLFVVYSLPGVGGLLGISTVESGEKIDEGSETLLRFFVINAGLFIVGSIYVEIGNALFKGIEWARVAILIFMSIKLVVGGIIAIEAPYLLVLVVFDLFMLDYFRKPHVKEYFAGTPIENSFKRFTQRLKKVGVEDISTEKDEDGKSFSFYGIWSTGKVSTPKEKLQGFTAMITIILYVVFLIWFSETYPNDGSLVYELIRFPGLLLPAAVIGIVFYLLTSRIKKFRIKVTS